MHLEKNTLDSFPENLMRNSLPIDTTYQYQLFTHDYIDQVVDVFTRAFCRSEPMTRYLKMDEDKYKIFARAVSEKAVEDQLSIIALDQGKVIAFTLVEDIADPGPIPDFDPKFRFILGLLDALGGDFFKDKVFEKKHIAHLFITAVEEKYRKLNLSTQVNFRAMDLAANAGFDFMYCEFTHYYNELGLIPHLHYWKEKIGSMVYQDFQMENHYPFKLLPGSANSYLWKLHEDAVLSFRNR